ncbi:hypothetical protein V5O39_09145 [Pseudomonas parakoreensis]
MQPFEQQAKVVAVRPGDVQGVREGFLQPLGGHRDDLVRHGPAQAAVDAAEAGYLDRQQGQVSLAKRVLLLQRRLQPEPVQQSSQGVLVYRRDVHWIVLSAAPDSTLSQACCILAR